MLRAAKPRLAVVGCGAVAAYGHLPALARLGWRPTVLVDVRRERAEQLAERWGIPRVAPSASAVLGDIDAAVVAVPPLLHAPVSLPLLRAGVHTLVEKPLSVSVADAKAMVAAAAASGACLAVGHQRRFLFVNRWLRAAIRSGALGRVERVCAGDGTNYLDGNAVGFGDAGWNLPSYWRAAAATSGGGVLLDKGPHVLDMLLWWLGPVAEVVDYADDNEGGMEADAQVELRFECGAGATLAFSRLRELSNTVSIVGTKGRVEAALHRNAILRMPESLRRRRYDVRAGSACLDEGMWGRGGPGERQLADWLGAIRDSRKSAAPGSSAVPVAALIEQCYALRRPHSNGRRATAPAAIPTLRGRTVLVTGAGGFIGGWLVRRLVRAGVRVRAAVRRPRTAARIARLPASMVELRRFEMAGAGAAAAACDLVAGCAAVFHLALDLRAPEANVEGVRHLGAACAKHGVRLVFTSSYTVHRPFPDGWLSESHPRAKRPAQQPSANARCEQAIERMARADGLDATVLRPTIVYGPFATQWTAQPAAALRRGPIVLPPVDGICNAVYVEDVVSALVAAAVRPRAAGETFLISGPEHPTWAEFYRHLGNAVGSDHGVVRLTEADIARGRRRWPAVAARLRAEVPRRPWLGRILRGVKRRATRGLATLPRLWRALVWRRDGSAASLLLRGASAQPTPTMPRDRHVEEYAAKCRVSIDRARRGLGYAPAYTLARGMAATAGHLRWASADHRRDANTTPDEEATGATRALRIEPEP